MLSKDVARDGKVICKTERLILREMTEDDSTFINELLNTPKFIKYIGDRGVRSDEDARLFIRDRYRKSYEQHGYGLYAVDQKSSGTPVGICGLVRRDTLPAADLGFAFLPEYEGQGYGYESSMAVIKYARETFGFSELLAITSLNNVVSVGLLKKVGFELESVIDTPEGERLNLFRLRIDDSILTDRFQERGSKRS
jgi:ribosomal-protein-alanine N-acetyltransferase